MAISRPDQAISAQAAALYDQTDYCYKSLSQSCLPQCRPLDLLYLLASRPLQPAPPLSALRMIVSLHIGTAHTMGAGVGGTPAHGEHRYVLTSAFGLHCTLECDPLCPGPGPCASAPYRRTRHNKTPFRPYQVLLWV